MDFTIEDVAGRLERAADRMIDTGHSEAGVQALLMAERIREEALSVDEAEEMEQAFYVTGRADAYQRGILFRSRPRMSIFTQIDYVTDVPYVEVIDVPPAFIPPPTPTFGEELQGYLPSDPVEAERIMEQIESDTGLNRNESMNDLSDADIDRVKADLDSIQAADGVWADAVVADTAVDLDSPTENS